MKSNQGRTAYEAIWYIRMHMFTKWSMAMWHKVVGSSLCATAVVSCFKRILQPILFQNLHFDDFQQLDPANIDVSLQALVHDGCRNGMFQTTILCQPITHMPSWSSTMPSWSSTKRHEGSLCLCASNCKQCSDSTSLQQHILYLLGSCTTMAHLLASCSNLVKWNVLHNNSLPTNSGYCH